MRYLWQGTEYIIQYQPSEENAVLVEGRSVGQYLPLRPGVDKIKVLCLYKTEY